MRRISLILVPVIVFLVFIKFFDSFIPSGLHKKTESPSLKKTEKIKDDKIVRSLPRKENASLHTIVIDPGLDTGCAAPNTMLERKLTLSFSFILARMLRMKGVSAYMTRTSDYSTSDEDKYEFAMEQNADLVVSVHTECSDNRSKKGIEVFGHEFDNKSSAFLEKEERIGNHILSAFGLKDNFERREFLSIAPFKDISAIMFFMGYVSNKEDWRNMNKETYLEKMADKLSTAIAEGLTRKFPLRKPLSQ